LDTRSDCVKRRCGDPPTHNVLLLSFFQLSLAVNRELTTPMAAEAKLSTIRAYFLYPNYPFCLSCSNIKAVISRNQQKTYYRMNPRLRDQGKSA
jgi:hypothetical protein